MSTPRTTPTGTEIRRVARYMFATRGFAGTSIRDIAHEVGIQGASMYNHFASKEEILWDLTLSAFEALNKSWGEIDIQLQDADPTERLAGFVRAHVRYHATRTRDACIINAELHRLLPDHYDQALAMRDAYQAVLLSLLNECLAAGRASTTNARVTVFAILQMGVAVSGWYRDDGTLSVDELCDIYVNLALKMIG